MHKPHTSSSGAVYVVDGIKHAKRGIKICEVYGCGFPGTPVFPCMRTDLFQITFCDDPMAKKTRFRPLNPFWDSSRVNADNIDQTKLKLSCRASVLHDALRCLPNTVPAITLSEDQVDTGRVNSSRTYLSTTGRSTIGYKMG